MNLIIIMSLFSSVLAHYNSISTSISTLSLNAKILMGISTESYMVRNLSMPHYVSSNQTLHIVLPSYHAQNIKCWINRNTHPINTFYTESVNSVVQVTVSKSMSGVWWCDVNEYKNIHKYLLLPINVEHIEAPLSVLVNRVILSTREYSAVQYTAQYEYIDGDIIEVACVSSHPDCTLHMVFEPFDESVQNMSSQYQVSFHMTLQKGHNNSHLTCNCVFPNDAVGTSIKTSFILQEELDDIIHLEIDGNILRGKRVHDGYNYLHFNYAFTYNEGPFNVVTYTRRNDIIIKNIYYNCNTRNIKNFQVKDNRHSLQIIPQNLSSIIYDAKSKNDQTVIKETIVLTFVAMTSNILAEKNEMTMWIIITVGVTVIILVCVSITVIYRIKKRKLQTQVTSNQYEDITPTYFIENDLYAMPETTKNDKNTQTPTEVRYATPTQIIQRRNDIPDIVYANQIPPDTVLSTADIEQSKGDYYASKPLYSNQELTTIDKLIYSEPNDRG